MKKINITLIMLLALALVFTGCRGEGGEDTTAPSTVTESPTETTSPETTAEETTSVPETTECQHYSYVTEEITASCADEKAFANSHCIACGYSWSVPVRPPAHNYVDGVCKGCGDTLWSVGLEFRTFADYAVVVGIGTCEDSEVIIPATYNGLPVTEIWDRAFYQVKNLFSVTIPEGVKYIESEAFLNCPDLREIHLPASLENVTGSLSIGFMNCPALEFIELAEGNEKYFAKNNCLIEKSTGKLVLGGGNTVIPADGSVKSIGAHAFAGNLLLKSINIPEGVTDIHTSAFEGCTKLASVTLPKTLKTIRQSAFKGCTALTSIAIPDSVTEIYNGAFSDCKNLKNVTLSKNLTMIDSEAFKGCAIEKIAIPAGVKELGAAFSECEKLKTVTLPEGFERFVGHTFAGCTSLESIDLPASLKYIGMYTFKDCTALNTVRFSGSADEWNSIEKQEKWNEGAAFTEVKCAESSEPSGSQGLEYKVIGDRAVLVSAKNCRDKHIVIAPEYNGFPVVTIDNKAFYSHQFVETVEIPAGITAIGILSFADCPVLREITLPEGLTLINNEAFLDCRELKKVTLPSTVDMIGTHAFSGCTALEKINFPAGLRWISAYAFLDCKSLTSVTFGNKLESIEIGAFFNCSSIKFVTIPASVSYLGNGAFWACRSLESVTIKKGVSMIESYPFRACEKLKSIKYTGKVADWNNIPKAPDWAVDSFFESVKCSDGEIKLTLPSETDVYDGTQGLKYQISEDGKYAILISHGGVFARDIEVASTYNGLPVTEIAKKAFFGSVTLVSVKLPDNIKRIGESAFGNCQFLKDIRFPKNLESIGKEAFVGCKALEELVFSNVESIGLQAFNGCPSLKSITADSIKNIGNLSFENCTALEKIDFGEGLESIGDAAFKDCKALSDIEFPDGFNSIGVSAFMNCNSITKITLPDSIEHIAKLAFRSCKALESITFGKNAKSIGEAAFSGCSSLKSISLPDSVEIIKADAYSYCGFESVVLPKNLKTIESGAFGHCYELTEITIFEGVETIGSSAFSSCVKLESVSLPDSVRELGGYLFQWCSALKSVKLPGGIDNIGDSTFDGCLSLTEITLPASLKQIGKNAFKDCTALKELCFSGSIAEWKSVATQEKWNNGAAFKYVKCSDGDGDILEITEAKALEKAAEYWRIVYGIKDGDPTPDSPSGTKYKIVVTELPSESSPSYKAQLQAVGISTKLLDELNIDAKTGNVILHADASERFYDILRGFEAKFFNVNGGYLAGKEVTLDEYCDAVWGKRQIFYTELDLDGDGVTELVIYDSALREATLVLHEENGVMYGFTFTEKAFDRLKTDGTFIYEAYPESGNKYEYYAAKLEFSGSECKTEKLFGTYVDTSDVYHYYNGNKSITKDDIDALWDIQNAKESPDWSPLGRWYLKKDKAP